MSSESDNVTFRISNCACKGIRTCITCENTKCTADRLDVESRKKQRERQYMYCDDCKKAWLVINQPDLVDSIQSCNVVHTSLQESTESIDFAGIDVLEEFITESEERYLCEEIERCQWVDSQSGRRKQDYGPKVNFKKKKLNCTNFSGLPAYSRFLVDRFLSHPRLVGFVPVELCNLEYQDKRGSAIDPHFDDFWLWGERLITINMLSSTVLTFVQDSVDCVDNEVLVMMPRRSLIIVYGPSRYQWKHSVKREHIFGRRIAMTFRELTPEFSIGGSQELIGRELVKKSLSYLG